MTNVKKYFSIGPTTIMPRKCDLKKKKTGKRKKTCRKLEPKYADYAFLSLAGQQCRQSKNQLGWGAAPGTKCFNEEKLAAKYKNYRLSKNTREKNIQLGDADFRYQIKGKCGWSKDKKATALKGDGFTYIILKDLVAKEMHKKTKNYGIDSYAAKYGNEAFKYRQAWNWPKTSQTILKEKNNFQEATLKEDLRGNPYFKKLSARQRQEVVKKFLAKKVGQIGPSSALPGAAPSSTLPGAAPSSALPGAAAINALPEAAPTNVEIAIQQGKPPPRANKKRGPIAAITKIDGYRPYWNARVSDCSNAIFPNDEYGMLNATKEQLFAYYGCLYGNELDPTSVNYEFEKRSRNDMETCAREKKYPNAVGEWDIGQLREVILCTDAKEIASSLVKKPQAKKPQAKKPQPKKPQGKQISSDVLVWPERLKDITDKGNNSFLYILIPLEKELILKLLGARMQEQYGLCPESDLYQELGPAIINRQLQSVQRK